MPKKSENVSESQKPNMPDLPNFLVVGTPSRATKNGGMSLGEERLRKLLNWYDLATPQLKESEGRFPATPLGHGTNSCTPEFPDEPR